MEPLVSIIIPVFNCVEALPTTLKSILNQTYKNIEIIFIDDASTDITSKRIKEYIKKDSRIKLFSTDGEGFSFSKNLGIQKSKGKYIMFFEIGNIMSINLVEYLISISEENKSDISICDFFETEEAYFLNEEIIAPTQEKESVKALTSKEILLNLAQNDIHLFQNTSVFWNKLIKKSILKNFTFPLEKEHSDEFGMLELLKNDIKIISSNQKLISHTILDEYYEFTCFNYADLEMIEFLQILFTHFKQEQNMNAVKNILFHLLDILTDIRQKLGYYYLTIYDKKDQKKNIDLKFNSIYKFINNQFPNEITEYTPYFKKYKEILSREKFRKKYFYLYRLPDKNHHFEGLNPLLPDNHPNQKL